MADEETFSIEDCKGIAETDKAVRVEFEDEDGVPQKEWVPRSQIHDDSEVYGDGHEGTLVVTAWIAKQKGWL